jgi:hypothetical protein
MNQLNFQEVRKYVNEHINTFHEDRIRKVSETTLQKVISKNPYLSRAKNITKASELVEGALNARLSSSEEELFGNFLEALAIYIAEQTTGGRKSGVAGLDLEFDYKDWHYFISIKSGIAWGNKDQHDALKKNFNLALNTFKQNKGQRSNVDAILGICYGKTRTARQEAGYLKVVGQNFWTFISGNQDLYKDIIEPIGYKAKEHNDKYSEEYSKLVNKLTKQFIEGYCSKDGAINWELLVEETCGNLDLEKNGFTF